MLGREFVPVMSKVQATMLSSVSWASAEAPSCEGPSTALRPLAHKVGPRLLDMARAVWRLGVWAQVPLPLLVATLRYSKGQQELCVFSQHSCRQL